MDVIPPIPLRDPCHGIIWLTDTARALVDTPPFQRLRRIQQLSQASLIYPSAVHTRFAHSAGAYHVANRVLDSMETRGELNGVDPDDVRLIPLAALLHDLGHYPAAHFLEEYGLEGACHEAAAENLLTSGPIGEILSGLGIQHAAGRIAESIRHAGDNPLTGIVSGACDADKIDYLWRDAYFSGVNVTFDREALIAAQTLVRNPENDKLVVGLDEMGLTGFEQLLMAKAGLYRTVYFDSKVRSATVMMRRLVVDAMQTGLVEMSELRAWTDEEFLLHVSARVAQRKQKDHEPNLVGELVQRLYDHRLYEAAVSWPLTEVPALEPDALVRVEGWLAQELKVAPGEVLLDIPHRPGMLSTDLWIRRANGAVVHASTLTPADGFAINVATESFYHASGQVTLFTARPRKVDPDILAAAVLATREF